MIVNNELPLVSVIIRSIDRPELQTALDSIAGQTYSRIEIILVNARGAEHRSVDERCGEHPVRMIGGGGPLHRSAAANLGLEAAAGDFLIFLDDDDWFLPDHIENLVAALQANPAAGGAYSAVECIRLDADGNREFVKNFDQPYDRVRLLIENYIPIHALLFRRALLTHGCRFGEEFDVYEDWDFWLQLSGYADFVFVNHISAVYRIIGDERGFGVNASEKAKNEGLSVLFRKWRSRWDEKELLGIAAYARYRPAFQELWERNDAANHALIEARALLESERMSRQEDMREAREEIAGLYKLVRDNNYLFRQAERQIAVLNKKNEQLAGQLHGMQHSHSWRLTRPLRGVMTLLRRFRRGARRYRTIAFEIWRQHGFLRMCTHILGFIRRRLGGSGGESVMPPQREKPQQPVWRQEAAIGSLSVPCSDTPEVSVIVAGGADALSLLTCLKSIVDNAGNAGNAGIEVLLVMGRGCESRDRMLESVSGVRVVIIEKTGDDIDCESAWNAGALQARGRFLVFLCGSEMAAPGWLAHLLTVRRRFDDAGMVGSRVFDSFGLVRSAGGIVWRDGGCERYGSGAEADAPECSYVRRTDFCPDAGFLIERSLFDSLGGFDLDRVPAMRRRADLAFKVLESGKRIYVQPAAMLVDFAAAAPAFENDAASAESIEEDAQTAARLSWQPERSAGEWAARDADVRQRVLVVDWLIPTPDQDSGSLRMFNLLEELVRLNLKVVLAIYQCEDKHQAYLEQLQQIGVEVWYPPLIPDVESYLQRHGIGFDVVILSRLVIASRLGELAREHAWRAKLVYDTVDLHYLRERRMADLTGDARHMADARRRKLTEVGLMRMSDMTLVVSPFEQALLKKEYPDIQVEVVSNIHDVHGCAAPFGEREGILFIGGFDHLPNVDAVTYYVQEVLPHVLRELGPVKTWIIGSNPPEAVLALASEHVIVEGYVEDVSAHFARARMSVAPLRYGAGVKGKVNMSMAYGLPCVVTPVAAEGMSLKHGVDAMVGESAEAFAQCMVQLYRDEQLWNTLSANGIVNVETHFSRSAVRQGLQRVLNLDAI